MIYTLLFSVLIIAISLALLCIKMILQKKGKEMTLRVLNAKGETLKELNL